MLFYDAASIVSAGFLTNSHMLSFLYDVENAEVWIHLRLNEPAVTNDDELTDDLWLEFENVISNCSDDFMGIVTNVATIAPFTLQITIINSINQTRKYVLRADAIYLRKRKYSDEYNVVLAKSENYLIRRQNEEANLLFRHISRRSVCVGDHYGDVQCAAISPNEQWCVTCGAGVILYHLAEPFETYNYDIKTPQWVEFGREPESINYVEVITAINDTEVCVCNADGENITYPFPNNS